MKSSKYKKAVIVGLFTVIGIAILIIGVFALGGQHNVFVKSSSLKAFFADVNGLAAGNNVWYEGVKVGTVKSVSLSGEKKVEVIMRIENKLCKYIHCDAKALVGSDGLMGNKIVRIVGGTDQTTFIKDGDTIEVDRAVSTDELAATLQKNNLNLLDITGDLKTVTKSIANGDGTIGALLKDKSLLNNLQSVVAIMKQASVNAKQITSNVADYSSRLQTQGSFSNDLVSDTIIFCRLRQAALQIEYILNTLSEAAGNLDKASQGLNDSTKLAGALIHDRQMKANVDELINKLDSASYKLNEDLEAVQHNFLFRGYFSKKAKQENKGK